MIDGVLYGDPQLLVKAGKMNMPVDSLTTRLARSFPPMASRFSFDYEYDFGDGWEHEILFEGCLRAKRAFAIRFAWKVNGPVRPRMSAAPTATKSFWRRWLIPSMKNTSPTWNGVASSMPRNSMPKPQREECNGEFSTGGKQRKKKG